MQTGAVGLIGRTFALSGGFGGCLSQCMRAWIYTQCLFFQNSPAVSDSQWFWGPVAEFF